MTEAPPPARTDLPKISSQLREKAAQLRREAAIETQTTVANSIIMLRGLSVLKNAASR